MMRTRSLISNQRGVSAVEFGLLAPVFISFIIGTTQLGTLFFANADMRNALATGARVASVWPVPQPAAVKSAVEAHMVREGANSATVTVTDSTKDANGNPYMRIAVTYNVPLNFLFFSPTVRLGDTRTVLLQRSIASASTTTTPPATPTTPEPTPTTPTEPVTPTPTPPTTTPPTTTPPTTTPPTTTPPGKDKDDKHEDHGTCKKKC